MVFPLIGLLGLGAAAVGKPHYDNYAAQTRGNYNQGVMEGIDPNDPNATRNALFGGGLIDGTRFQADSRQAFEGLQGRLQSDRNSRRSAATAAARLNFDRERVMYERNQAEQLADQRRQYNQSLIREHGTPGQIDAINNAFTPPDRLDEVANAVLGSLTAEAYDVTQDPAYIRQSTLNQEAADAALRQSVMDNQFEVQEQRRAADAAAELEQFELEQSYIAEAQPIEDQLQQVDQAIESTLDMSNFGTQFFGTPEATNNRNMVNRLLFAQRMQFVRDNYGDAEPPPAVMESIEGMFPLIANRKTQQNDTEREIIRQNLSVYRQTLGLQLDDLARPLASRGLELPGVTARNALPDGWEVQERSGGNE